MTGSVARRKFLKGSTLGGAGIGVSALMADMALGQVLTRKLAGQEPKLWQGGRA